MPLLKISMIGSVVVLYCFFVSKNKLISKWNQKRNSVVFFHVLVTHFSISWLFNGKCVVYLFICLLVEIKEESNERRSEFSFAQFCYLNINLLPIKKKHTHRCLGNECLLSNHSYLLLRSLTIPQISSRIFFYFFPFFVSIFTESFNFFLPRQKNIESVGSRFVKN